MANYKIYTHPNKRYQAVKEGFCWGGFFFTGLWSISHRMWKVSFGLWLFFTLIIIIMDGGNPKKDQESLQSLDFILNGSSIVASIYLGIFGNQLRENSLKSKNFKLDGEFNANNSKAAIALFLQNKN